LSTIEKYKQIHQNSKFGTTVTEHLLSKKKNNKLINALINLFNELIISAKIINHAINKAELAKMLGDTTGKYNIQGEQISKLDEFAHNTIIHRMIQSNELCVMGSEEEANPIEIPSTQKKGTHILLFDPLDGSSNINANVSIGTIFSILRKQSTNSNYHTNDLLQPGFRQIAAGYFLYGSSTIMVYTIGNGVNAFTLDPDIGEFMLSHPNIKIPFTGNIFSANLGHWNFWSEQTKNHINYLRTSYHNKPAYSCRYIGSLVADFHRTLLYGGVFLYPADTKDPKKPYGKLRLLYECNPLAFIVEQAGGLAISDKENITEIIPNELHQRTPIIIGSPEEITQAKKFYNN